MHPQPVLEKRVSLRTAKRQLAAEANVTDETTPPTSRSRAKLTQEAERIAREEVRILQQQQQQQHHGRTQSAASGVDENDALALLQARSISRGDASATAVTTALQVEAVRALSSMFQPTTNITPPNSMGLGYNQPPVLNHMGSSPMMIATPALHHMGSSPLMRNLTPQYLLTPNNMLSPSHGPQVHTPNGLAAVSRASSFAMPILAQQPSFGYPNSPNTPIAYFPGLQHQMSLLGGLNLPMTAPGMNHPLHPLAHPAGTFLQPPMPASPSNMYRPFSLTPSISYSTNFTGASAGTSAYAAGKVERAEAPYRTTKLPILHPWFWQTKGKAGVSPAEPLASSIEPVDLTDKASFARSLRRALRVNLAQANSCMPLEDLTSIPVWVNEKQYKRYVRRAAARKRKAILAAGMNKGGAGVKHLSRQLHAARRVRGKGGRFLTKEEKAQAALEAKLGGGDGGSSVAMTDDDE